MSDTVKPWQKERRRHQAHVRHERNRAARLAQNEKEDAAIEAAQSEDQAATDVTPTAIESAAPTVLTERDKTWQGYCKYAVNLHRHPDGLAQFKIDLQAGRRPDVTEPALMAAAIQLVADMPPAGVRRWDWLPAPSGDDLADPAAWATRRLAEQRAAQDSAERIRRGQHQLARALGGPRSIASGTINPVYLQQSKHSLEELARRLGPATRAGKER